jgi:hypothetical protein
LSGLLDFAQVAEVMDKVGQMAISTSTVWRQANRWGAQLKHQQEIERAIATALPNRAQVVSGEVKTQQRMGASLDGALVPVRKEGWKEVKIGSVFATELRPTKDKATGEMVDLARAVNTTYVAHLGGPGDFAQALWAEARQRQWSRAADTVIVADGAAWIWNIVAEHFYDSVQVIDWYHSSEHLAQAANLVHGEGTPAAQTWRKEYEKVLFEGHAELITQRLNQLAKGKPKLAEGLRREAGYFREHQRRMNYLELREDGYPIGSGTVESGCKQFKARFAAAGTPAPPQVRVRWNRSNLENLLPVRAAIMSNRFDQAWRTIYKLPLN